MRKAFCESLVNKSSNKEFVFLTGDLGFMALEPLRTAMQDRFINAGVSEQNMVSVAAGLAKSNLRPWAYSIAPFIYARPFEQIRNDVCLHSLPVILVGNGGGYGYGVMGATHHSLEDYGALLTLPGMRTFIPAFDEDIKPMVDILFKVNHPCYLRLGVTELPKDFQLPEYNSWRKLLDGDGATLIIVGPLVGGILQHLLNLDKSTRPNLWLVSELAPTKFPEEFICDINRSGHLCVVEEHGSHGGAGQIIAHLLLKEGKQPKRFTTKTALGYPSGKYGSQKYHRAESGLDPVSICKHLGI